MKVMKNFRKVPCCGTCKYIRYALYNYGQDAYCGLFGEEPPRYDMNNKEKSLDEIAKFLEKYGTAHNYICDDYVQIHFERRLV